MKTDHFKIAEGKEGKYFTFSYMPEFSEESKDLIKEKIEPSFIDLNIYEGQESIFDIVKCMDVLRDKEGSYEDWIIVRKMFNENVKFIIL